MDIHHMRGRLGKLLTDERYFMAVCRKAHLWIHDNIELARQRGWICETGKWGVCD